MPSIFTLEGTRSALQGSSGLGDNALVSWLRTQNPIVAGIVGAGLAMAIGVVISQAAVFTLERLRR